MPAGFLNVAKEPGCTSHDVVARARRRFGKTVKVGHCGSLDPAARGVLVLAVGSATRLVEYVMTRDKEYRATIRLGVETDTYDLDGTVRRESPVPPLTDAGIEALFAGFRGTVQQAPPPVSAVKVAGERAYARARRGEAVAPAPRPVTISELTLLARRERELELRVVCGAGTYVRSLAHDLGAALGCGAAVAELTRTRVGDFTLAAALPQAELATADLAARLLPPDAGVGQFPAVELGAAEALRVRQGEWQALAAAREHPDGTRLRLVRDGRLLAIGIREQGLVRPVKVLAGGE